MVRTLEIKKPKILFFITEDWYFWSHRLALARAIRDAGAEVVLVTRANQYKDQIAKEGFKLIPISLKRRSKNPFRELITVLELIKIYRVERPDLVHHVAMKPILYGSCAAKILGISSVVNAFTGLGFVFVAGGWKKSLLQKLIIMAYKIVLSLRNFKVIFQNPDDLSLFLNKGIVARSNAVLIKGSGVNTTLFKPTPETGNEPLVILAARMLWDKGIKEFVEATQILRNAGIKARFVLVGKPDLENPSSVQTTQLEAWTRSGGVEWWGQRDDMPPVFAQSHIVCLPSYREGLPKVLIEAAACGRPIVTTDAPGCREIVRHGVNGLLVPVRNSQALADALQKLIENPALRAEMGARGREIVVNEFSEEKVIRETLAVYQELLGKRWSEAMEPLT